MHAWLPLAVILAALTSAAPAWSDEEPAPEASESGSGSDSDSGSESESESDTESGSDSGSDSGSETDVDSGSGSDTGSESESDVDSGSGSGSETDVDSGSDTEERLAPEIVQRTVKRRFHVFRGCYEDALREQRALALRLVVDFRIGSSGRIVELSSRLSHLEPAGASGVVVEGFRRCAEAAFASLEFPPPTRGEITVQYPIIFTPARRKAPWSGPLEGSGVPGQPALRIIADRPTVKLLAPAGRPDLPPTVLCAFPCDALVDLRDRPEVYFGGPGISPSRAFDLRQVEGPLVASVDSGGESLWTAGVVIASVGGAAVVGGAVMLGLGYGASDDFGSLRVGGTVTLLLGAVTTGFGIGAITAGTTTVVWRSGDGELLELGARGATLRF